MTNLDTITSNELYVPGEFCCAKCGFTLSQFTLNANTGAIGDRDQPGEKCPNDGSPLWRVTWTQRAQDHFDRCTPVVTISAAEFDALHDALDHPVKPTPSIVEARRNPLSSSRASTTQMVSSSKFIPPPSPVKTSSAS